MRFVNSKSALEADLGDGVVEIGRGETFVSSHYPRGSEREIQPARPGSASAARRRSQGAAYEKARSFTTF
jgi:hypothetical protein